MAHTKKAGEKDVVKLCKDCDACPTADFSGDNVILKDDFGGTVKLTKAQADMLGDEIHARRKAPKTARG